MKKITLLLAFLLTLCFISVSSAQDGANDPTFNPADTGFGNGTDEQITCQVVQPDGKIIIGGGFTKYQGHNRNFIARINANESLDETFNIGQGANNVIYDMVLQPDGKVLIAGIFTQYNGVTANSVARINTDGSLDETFNSGSGTNGPIYKIILQPDGKIIIGGSFPSNIARLNADGSADTSFVIGTGANSTVFALAIQPDGKIVLGGDFTDFNNHVATKVVRLNNNGTVDSGFSAQNINIVNNTSTTVRTLAIQSDGKIYVGGFFNNPSLGATIGLVRLNSNGGTDSTFNISAPVLGGVHDIEIQSDNKIVIVGYFSKSDTNNVSNHIARINPDGSTDESFQSVPEYHNYAILDVSIAVSGKIIISGTFLEYNNISRNYIACLNANGELDTNFSIGHGTGADNTINALAQLPNNKILIAGAFHYYNGVNRNMIAKIDAEGTIDESFNTGSGPDSPINYLAVQPDGKIIVRGEFTLYNGVSREGLARIDTNGNLDAGYNPAELFGLFALYDMAMQADGKLLLAGVFELLTDTGSVYSNIVRINVDGSYDTSFVPYLPMPIPRGVKVLLQPDGKIILGIQTTDPNGDGIYRLNDNGSRDDSFTTAVFGNAFSKLNTMVLDYEGNILLSGVVQDTTNLILRLTSNGEIDEQFVLSGIPENEIYIAKILPQEDGKILVIRPKTANAVNTKSIIRLNVNGDIDATFDSGTEIGAYAYSSIKDMLLQHGGKIIIAGEFTKYNGAGRNRIARIFSSGSLDVKNVVTVKNDVIAFRNENSLIVNSPGKNISAVELYGLSGKFIAGKDNISNTSVSIANLSIHDSILLITIVLEDGTKVNKKIYY